MKNREHKNAFKNMQEREMQEQGAIRLFEAISGVEEALLVRSEKQNNLKKMNVFSYRGKILAACFCFVVIGACWSVGVLFFSPKGATSESAREEITENQAAQEPSLSTGGNSSENSSNSSAVSENFDDNKQQVQIENQNTAQSDGIKETQNGATEEFVQEMETNEEDIVACSTPCPTDNGQQLSEDEARAVEILGDYIPTVLPKGYVFESAFSREGSVNGEICLSLTWTKGLDYIHLNIRPQEEMPELYFADMEEPETYDVRLYTIPYGESVPSEYRNVFNNPVFKEKDFNRAIIEARLKVVEDKGDTSTPRGNFAVLYEKENILVQFSGRGDVDSIFQMFQSIEQ